VLGLRADSSIIVRVIAVSSTASPRLTMWRRRGVAWAGVLEHEYACPRPQPLVDVLNGHAAISRVHGCAWLSARPMNRADAPVARTAKCFADRHPGDDAQSPRTPPDGEAMSGDPGQQTGSKRLKWAWLNHAEASASEPRNPHE
jgi:hypothetical protein